MFTFRKELKNLDQGQGTLNFKSQAVPGDPESFQTVLDFPKSQCPGLGLDSQKNYQEEKFFCSF